MQDTTNPQKKIVIISVAAGVVLLGLIIFILNSQFSKKATDPNADKSLDTTTMTSPLAEANDNLTVNYGGDVAPNNDAVVQAFKVFGVDSLGLPPAVKASLDDTLIAGLAQRVIPTYPNTYAQIKRSSITCSDGNTCKMMVYIDSPETYFEFSIFNKDGVPGYTLTEQPWKGITQ